MSEPTVRLEPLAAILGISLDTFRRRLALGEIPQADFNRHKQGACWRLSTIKRWNPQVSAKIQRAIDAEIFTLRPAA